MKNRSFELSFIFFVKQTEKKEILKTLHFQAKITKK